jgi:D-threo-aldose 1-dehydrogenase
MALTALAFGGAPIGNLYHQVGDDEACRAVEAAWTAGIRYFDTAPHYGLGLSERRLGAALRERPREEFVISTKVGRLLVPDEAGRARRDTEGFDVPAAYRRQWDFSRDGVLRSVEESLGRLRLDRVDVVFLHDPDEHWRQAVDEGYPALAELRDQGVVSAIGAGMNQTRMLAEFVRHTDMDLLLQAGRYTLADQSALDELLPLCADRGVGVIAAGALGAGLLARPRPGPFAKYNYVDAAPEVIARATRIADVCERHGTTLPAVALRFPLAHPAVISVAVGCRDAAEVRGNVATLDTRVPAELWEALRVQGLLRADAPVPPHPEAQQ